MDVDPPVVDLTDSDDNETTNEMSDAEGLSPSSDSDNSNLYNDGRQTFLSVPIINIDEDPAENIKPILVHGPSMVMLPGPSVLKSLILIEEDIDVLDNLRFIPPSLRGGEAGLDVEVKEEDESEGKVTGTPEFRAGDYE